MIIKSHGHKLKILSVLSSFSLLSPPFLPSFLPYSKVSYPSSSLGASGGTRARLDVSSLVPVVQELGLAASTQRVYRSGSNRYLTFYARFNVPPFPVSEHNLSLFVAFLYRKGLLVGMVKSYLSAVRHTQISVGLGDPHANPMPQLEYISKGFKKMTSHGSWERQPITPSILWQLSRVWQSDQDQYISA